MEAGGSYFIINTWGGIPSTKLIEKHRRALAKNKYEGYEDSSEEVLGESLALMGLTWIAEKSTFIKMSSQIMNFYNTYHHCIGICGQEQGEGPYIDIGGLGSSEQSLGGNVSERDFSFGTWGFGSALEAGMIEQLQPGRNAVSTVSLLDMANETGYKIFKATSSNWSSIKSQVENNYESDDISSIENLVNDGEIVILPEYGNLTVDQWSGAGWAHYKIDYYGAGYMISGEHYGGHSSSPDPVDNDNVIAQAAVDVSSLDLSSSQPTTVEPINLVTGSYLYEHSDLTIGSGSYPFSLELKRSYNSGIGLEKGPLGLGWTHNFDITAEVGSNGFQSMGADSPMDAAAAIVTTYICVDLIASSDSLKNFMVMTMLHKWLMDQMIDNIVTINKPGNAMQFVKVPNGASTYSYNPPPGIADKLTLGSGAYSLKDKNGNILAFDTQGRADLWSDPHNNTVDYVYDTSNRLGWIKSFLTGYTPSIRTLTFNYNANNLIGSVADSAIPTSRSVQYGYDAKGNLTTFTDVESRQTKFEYDPVNDGWLTQIKYPTDPINPFVTNIYDDLGRVEQQTNANNYTYDYYYSYYRSEEEQPIETPPIGSPQRFSKIYYFDDNGNTVAEKDQLGRETTYQYDGQQRLKRVDYPTGNATEYSYDDNHNVIEITQIPVVGSGESAITEKFFYESWVNNQSRWFNKLRWQRDTSGKQTDYRYDFDDVGAAGVGYLIKVTYPEVDLPGGAGRFHPETSLTYNTYGQVLTETKRIDNTNYTTTKYEYYAPGASRYGALMKTTIDDGGLRIQTSYDYDSVGNITTKTDPQGNITTYEYYPSRLLKKEIAPAPLNYETQYEYYPDGKLKSVEKKTEAPEVSQITSCTYTPTGNKKTVCGPVGNAAGDSVGNNDGIVKGAIWTTGKVSSALDFDGKNDYVEVADSPELSFTNPGLTIAAWVYLFEDQTGERAIVRKNDQWQLGIFPYDNKIRNLVKTSGTNGWVTTHDVPYTINANTWYFFAFTYDGTTGVCKLKNYVNGSQVGTDFTVSGNIIDQTNAMAIGSDTGGGTLNVNGIIDEVVIFKRALDVTGISTLYQNGLDGKSAITGFEQDASLVSYWGFDEGQVNLTRYEYDSLDRLSKITDGEDKITKQRYWPDGQLHEVIKVVGLDDDESAETDDIHSVTKTYNLETGLLESVMDAKYKETTYEYDGHARLKTTTYPYGTFEQLTYDNAGRLWQKTTRAGETISYTYDELNRLKTKTVPVQGASDNVIEYWYDLLSRQIKVTDSSGTIHNEFDNAGRLEGVTYTYPAPLGGQTVQYDYDAAGNRTKLTYPDGKGVRYLYDNLNRFTGIRNDDSLVGYWKMNEMVSGPTTVQDSSGYNNHGTAQQNTDVLHTDGKINGALTFNGNSDYITTSSDELKTLNNFTIALWFKAARVKCESHLIWQGETGGDGWGGQQEMHISLDDGENGQLEFFFGHTNDSDALKIETAFTDISNWHYVVVVVSNLGSAPQAIMYSDADGSFGCDGSDTTTPTYTSRNNWNVNLRIGKPSANNRRFDGSIDNIMVFDGALPPSAITELYNNGVSGSEEPPAGYENNLVGHWKMNEKESNMDPAAKRVVDCSGSGDHGTAQRPTTELHEESAGPYFNGALVFDGDVDYADYITTTSTILKTLNNFTIALWFKADQVKCKRHLIWQGQENGNGWGDQQEMHISLDDGASGQLEFFFGHTNNSNALKVETAFTDITNWHYVAVVVSNLGSAPQAIMYSDADGSFGCDGSDTTTPTYTLRNAWDCGLMIGRASTDERYFDGAIDNVMIFDEVLSPEEVEALYNATKEHDSAIVQYDYDALSARVSAKYENGTTADYEYDMADRLLSLHNTTNYVNHYFDYSYDNVGNRLNMWVNVIDDSHKHSYTYDDIYQLTSVDYQEGFFTSDDTFNYDPAGNRTSFATNFLNQYTQSYAPPSHSYSYDNNGNLTGDGTNSYTYDAENHLITATAPSHSLIYKYDPSGRRISKTDNTQATFYVYDGDQVICEYDSNGKLRKKFLYGTGIDETVRMSQVHKTADITGPPGHPDPDGMVDIYDLRAMAAAWLSVGTNAADLNYDGEVNNIDSDILAENWLSDNQPGEEHYYYHYDGLGSVAALSDKFGNTVEKYQYDVYGNVLIRAESNEPQTTSFYGNPYMFTGRAYDAETRLYYYRARYYDPVLGRFLQPDPIGYADSMNLYMYVGNNPIVFVDPFGLCGEYEGVNPAFWNFIGEAAGWLQTGIHTGLDIAGVWDPTGITDFWNAAGYSGEAIAGQGGWGNVAISAAAIIPYAGDFGKAGKYGSKAATLMKQARKTEGIYEFAAKSGKTYVGQSQQLGTRIMQHINDTEKLIPANLGTLKITPMPGSTSLERRIAEQIRINELGGVRKGGLANKINAIAPEYWDQYKILQP